MMNFAKRWGYRLAALCMCVSLFCCTAASAEEAANTVTAQQVMAAYQDVLLGEAPYTDVWKPEAQETALTPQVTEWGAYRFEKPFTYTRFCLTDLDADGLPEVVLDLTNAEGYTFGYELLRYENGIVYGFSFGLRSLQDFTLEGDVLTSGGAGDNGWYKLQFAAGEMQYAEICRMQSTSGYAQYFISGKEVTRDAYLLFTDQLMQKPRPVWLDFTDANVAFVAGEFQ